MVADILGCEVLLNGVRFADGREGDDMLAPLALDGLVIAWGRENSVDQPEPSTCTFEVMDAAGGAGFLTLLRTGSSIEVRSRSVVATGGGGGATAIPTLPDPTFDATPVGFTPPNTQGELATSVAVVDNGAGHELALAKLPDPSPATALLTRVLLAPGPFTSGDPDAWAMLPRVSADSQWSYEVDVHAPVNAQVHTQGAYIFAPDGLDVSGAGARTVTNTTGAGEWRTITRAPFILPDPAGLDRWLGLWVQVTFTRWSAWPAEDTWDTVEPADLTWADLSDVRVDNAQLSLYGEAASNDLVMFEGAITDVSVSWDESLPPAGGARLQITAANFTAQTANFYLGDEPWSAEPMSTRFLRVVTRVNQETNSDVGYSAVIDPDLGALTLGYQDVDNQAALTLLTSYAESVDGVLWPAVNITYPRRYFLVEDINKRSSGLVLRLDADGFVEVDDSGTETRTQLSACDVLRDPVAFIQTTEDTPTRVAVGWQEQTLDDKGQPAPTDRTVELVDADAEARYGTRRVQTTTLLTTEDDAEWHAERKMRRMTPESWRANGIVYDLAIHGSVDEFDLETQARAARLLDGTTRIGLPLVLTDLPVWSPAGTTLPLYLEGGTYEFNGGRWVLSLTVSNVYGAGSSAPWESLPPEWLWTSFGGPEPLSWDDLTAALVADDQLNRKAP